MSVQRRLLGNVISLAIVQGANYLIPLVSLPYLVRVLGPEEYGVFLLAQTVVQYFLIITDYGFNLSATRAISVARDNSTEVSQIFSSVILIKLTFCGLGFLVLSSLLLGFKQFGTHTSIYLLSYFSVLGSVLLPFWFFQGVEKVRWIPILSVAPRLLMLLGLFLLVKSPQDLPKAAFLQSFASVISGLLAISIIRHVYPNLRWIWPTPKHLRFILVEGWPVFITTASFTAYTSYSLLFLGLFFNNSAVGNYGAGEKVIRAMSQGLFQPIHQALFPHVSLLAQQSQARVISFNKRILLILVIALTPLAFFLVVLANPLVHLLFGTKYTSASTVIIVMSLLPLFTATSGILGSNTLLVLGHSRTFSRTYIVVALVSLLLTGLLVKVGGQLGAAWAALLTEVLVTGLLWLGLKRSRIL
jgi:polysaccharide transporter, PST family